MRVTYLNLKVLVQACRLQRDLQAPLRQHPGVILRAQGLGRWRASGRRAHQCPRRLRGRARCLLLLLLLLLCCLSLCCLEVLDILREEEESLVRD